MLATAGRDSANLAVGAVVIGGAGFASLFALLVTAAQLGVPARLLGLVSGEGSCMNPSRPTDTHAPLFSAQTASVRAVGISRESPKAATAPWFDLPVLAPPKSVHPCALHPLAYIQDHLY